MHSILRNHETCYTHTRVANEAWCMRIGVAHKIIWMNTVATFETTKKLLWNRDPPSKENIFQLQPISALLFHRENFSILKTDRTLWKACHFSDFLVHILAISSLESILILNSFKNQSISRLHHIQVKYDKNIVRNAMRQWSAVDSNLERHPNDERKLNI